MKIYLMKRHFKLLSSQNIKHRITYRVSGRRHCWMLQENGESREAAIRWSLIVSLHCTWPWTSSAWYSFTFTLRS